MTLIRRTESVAAAVLPRGFALDACPGASGALVAFVSIVRPPCRIKDFLRSPLPRSARDRHRGRGRGRGGPRHATGADRHLEDDRITRRPTECVATVYPIV